MANPSVLSVDTTLYSAAEPDGRVFPAGHEWPGDAWSANPGGEPVGKKATAQAMKDLIAAQNTVDRMETQLAAKDHDLAILASERDAASGKIAALEQRAIAGEKGQADAEARAADYMRERDAARADFQRVSEQVAAANARVTELEPEAAKVPGLVEQLAAANQALADANGKIAAQAAEIAKMDPDGNGKVGGARSKPAAKDTGEPA